MYLNNLFSEEKVNTGRQAELDIAKTLSIIFMVFVHVVWMIFSFDNNISSGYALIYSNILGRPCAAPIFMFCMGVGIVYSRHSQWGQMIKRGITLFLAGIVVNVFEFFIPYYVYGYLFGSWDVFTIAGGLLLFCIDILEFAGLTFILLGISKKLKISNETLLIIAIAMSIIGSVLRYTDFGMPVLNLFFGYFIGTKGGFTAFPLFNWFIIPVAGYVWGQYFIRAKDKNQFFKYWPIYLIIALIYFVVSTQISNGFLTDIHQYYFMTFIDALFCLLYAHANIGLCYYLSKILPDIIIKAATILSSHIINIYVTQWLFVPLITIFIAYIFKGIVFTDWMAIIISIFALGLSIDIVLRVTKRIKGLDERIMERRKFENK